MFFCYRFFVSVLILLLSFSVRAQVDPVVVTATRTAQSVDATLAAVSVIDRQQIESLQPESVADLLRTVPGIGPEVERLEKGLHDIEARLRSLMENAEDAEHRVRSEENGTASSPESPETARREDAPGADEASTSRS